MARTLGALGLLAAAAAQQVGTNSPEQHPPFPLWTCTARSCVKQKKAITIDANWRWVHDSGYTNCYTGTEWDASLCPDGETCSKNCHLDGVSQDQYVSNYGITTLDNGVELGFVTQTQNGANYGSRVYVMDGVSRYKIFKLKNKEFSMTVDVSKLPCGLNGAVYFVEMDADGGRAASKGLNKAGAKFGTGYCDAQCPHDIKFVKGIANSEDWDSSSDPPIGKYGSCCAELDIWEANSRSTAYTAHPCNIEGSIRCDGTNCGDTTAGERYDGVCDKDGCDFNNYRLGNKTFYGRVVQGRTDFNVNTREPFTVVTQFITSDGTDDGDLVEIKRFYVQDGKKIENSAASIAGLSGNSLTDDFCFAMKDAFDDTDDFGAKGGLAAMGDAMGRGMVLVMSLWDDSVAQMLWLDSAYPSDKDPSEPGVLRGPCLTTTGDTTYVRQKFPDASVKYMDFKFGPIGSTTTTASNDGNGGDDPYGDNRRLRGEEVHV